MKKQQLAFSVLTAIAVASVCLARSGQQKQIKSQTTETQSAESKSVARRLVGTWKLAAYEVERPNGELIYPFGQAPAGILTYDRGGHMAVQIMRPDRPNVDRDKATAEDIQAAYKGYVAYFGTFTVNDAGDTVIHHVQGSLDTWRVGGEMVRPLTLMGNRLILSTEYTSGGELRKYKITWERVP